MKSEANSRSDSSEPPFQRFEELARKLIRVPKSEIDEQEEQERKRRKKSRKVKHV